jgi:hypothetical protein
MLMAQRIAEIDVILSSSGERDALRDRYRDWLSTHPAGFVAPGQHSVRWRRGTSNGASRYRRLMK